MSIVTVIQQGQRAQIVTVVGVRGAQGRPGDGGGSGMAVVRTAGAATSALRVVWEDVLGNVWPLSADDAAHIDLCVGLTLTAAAAGADVTVARSGIVDVAGLDLVPGRVWLGAAGQLTQVPPAAGFDVLVGFATAADRMQLAMDAAIALT